MQKFLLTYFIFLFSPPILFSQSSVLERKLHTNWTFQEKNSNKWFPATVPGCVHTDLMTNGIIEDPYYRLNESKVQWVDKKDWIYQNIFETSEDEIELQNHELRFEGLDTYARVYLNDCKR